MDTERNLLFGLLAFQNGAIDADRLAETCADLAMAVGQDHSLADQLIARGVLTIEQKTQLDQAVESELNAHGGDPHATLAATVDGRSLEAIREFISGGKAGPKLVLPQAPAGHVLLSSIAADDKDRERYTLTHLHAKGGMGQVWKAHDAALGREIALKELRPDQADNNVVWSRFLYEARITAQLEHPGIVPVYELGEGNSPYYTMRFVKGRTLSEATRAYHKSRVAGTADQVGLVNLLAGFVAVCNAMAYAHSRGVIHRDLKGQNVVLGDFGEVIVLDWGLAKRLGADPGLHVQADSTAVPSPPSLAGTIVDNHTLEHDAPAPRDAVNPFDEPTLSPGESTPNRNRLARPPVSTFRASGAGPEGTIQGQLLGTPAYMAPEQAEGRHDLVNVRTDVYGLGAILYEILTGQPPFAAKKTTEVLRMVSQEAPTPPRQVNPSVSQALEAICLKALAKPQEDRYSSAGELAHEVQLYLADEPVTAFPEPWTRRAARWARRHRTAVAAAAALLITSTIALSVSTVLVKRERDEATTQGNQARTAVNDMYMKVAENWLEDRLDPLQKEFLEKTLAYYEKYTGNLASNPAVRLEHGRVYQRMGDIYDKFGRPDDAQKAYDNSLGLLTTLAAGKAADGEVKRALAVTQTRLGDLHFRHDRHEKAGPLYEQAEKILTPLAEAAKDGIEDRWLLARTLRGRAELLRRKGQIEAAMPVFKASRDLLEKSRAIDPKSPEVRNDLAVTDDSLGRLYRDFGDTAEREKAYRQSNELVDALVAEYPTVPRYREALYNASTSLGGVEYETGRWADAEGRWRRAYKEAERLAQDYPERPEYKHFLAGASSNLGGVLAELGRYAEAEPILRRGIELNTELAARPSDDQQVVFDLGKCHFNLGYSQLKQGRLEQAIASFEKARDTNGALVKATPQIPRYSEHQAGYLRRLGEALAALGRPGAEEAYRKAVAISERLAAQFPANALYQLELARCLNSFGALMADAKKPAEADSHYLKALESLDRKDVAAWTVERLREKSFVLSNMGELRRASGKPKAEEPLRESIKIAQELATRKPAAREDRQFLCIAQANLAELLENQGRNADAAALFDDSISRLKILAAESPGAIDDRHYLGYFHEQVGKLLAKTGKQPEAKAALEQAVTYQKEAVKLTGGEMPAYREKLAEHLVALAGVCLTLGAYDDARRAALDLPKAALDPAQGYFEAAKIFARSATLARQDTKLAPPAKREETVRKALGNTVLMLREALEANPKLSELLKTEPAFKDLMEQSEFQTLLGNLVDLARPGK